MHARYMGRFRPKISSLDYAAGRARVFEGGIARLALVGFVLAVVVAAGLVPIFVEAMRAWISQEESVARGYGVMREFDELRVSRAEAEASFRAFLYAADEPAQMEFDAAVRRMSRAWANIKSEFPDAANAAALGRDLQADIAAMRSAMVARQSANAKTAAQLLQIERPTSELDIRIPAMLDALRTEQQARIGGLQRERDSKITAAWRVMPPPWRRGGRRWPAAKPSPRNRSAWKPSIWASAPGKGLTWKSFRASQAGARSCPGCRLRGCCA